jgi:hypothetical protein
MEIFISMEDTIKKVLLRNYDMKVQGDLVDFQYYDREPGPFNIIIVKFFLIPKNISPITPKEVSHVSEFLYIHKTKSLKFHQIIDTFNFDDVPIMKYISLSDKLGEFIANVMVDKAQEIVSKHLNK